MGEPEAVGRLPNGQCYLYTSNGAGGFGYIASVGGNGWERYAQLT